MAGDMQLTCSDCGQDFTFTAADQTFFQERGYSTPKRCKNCRMAKKNDQGGSGYRSGQSQGTPVICSGCGHLNRVATARSSAGIATRPARAAVAVHAAAGSRLYRARWRVSHPAQCYPRVPAKLHGNS
jgi:hypothetical protein